MNPMPTGWKVLATVAVLLAALALLLNVGLYVRGQEQRRQAVELLCDQNRVLIQFIKAPPDLPRDAPALRSLKRERCDDLLRQVNRR